MIEVEAKFRISNIQKYRKIAGKLGRYLGRFKKIDDYYTLEEKGKYPKKSLRVRRVGDYYVINFKKKLQYKGGMFAKKEVEFKVSDIKGFLALIRDFGYRKWLRKEKITELYKIRKNFHIEINNVKGLGDFVEIEYLTDRKGIGNAERQILNAVKELGLKKSENVKEGYTKLLWNKKN